MKRCWLLLVLSSQCVSEGAAVSADDWEFFEETVRPVLIERCYECHGPEKQKGGLRLDSREAVLAGGDSGPALVPGHEEESLIIQAISYSDPDFQMPPKNRLPEREAAALREWVRRGAPDPRAGTNGTVRAEPVKIGRSHWAYQQPRATEPREVRNQEWPRTKIDQFILARIESRGLTPGADATREKLIRRLFYDLIGLPPAPERQEEFLRANSPGAYEELVDELLASRHFGERWGRHWLDIARFAESVTLRGLVFKEAWRYRDYVIESFNRDLPFDRFIKEQISGDLLRYETLEDIYRARAATTYLVLGNFNYEEQDKDLLRMDIVDEQLDAIGKGFLGQTLGCARCHDHKFDPIPTEDYYAMAGILRNTRSAEHANVSTWLELSLPLEPEDEKKIEEQERKLAELQRQIRRQVDLVAQATSGKAQKESTPVDQLPGVVVDDSSAELVGEWQKSEHTRPFIGEGYMHDLNGGKGSKTITFHPRMNSAGRYEVRLAYTPGENRASNVPVTILHAAGETTMRVNQQNAPPVDSHFVSLGQFQFDEGNQGYVLISNAETDGYVIADAVQFLPVSLPVDQGPALGVEAGAEADTDTVEQLTAQLERLRLEVQEVSERGPKRPMVMSVEEEKKIEEAHVLVRGNVHNFGAKVPRGFLGAANYEEPRPFPENESGRRQLADWIASTNNPLTARVYVNRVWGWLMGAGLVRTMDNFGTTGDAPSHKELLDHLAMKFMREGWSTKKLVREIVLSRTYQLAGAEPDSELVEADPDNRLFGRANRRRIDAEAMRDTILSVSGEIDLRAGGPTIEPGTTADFGYKDDSTRRSIYVPAFRNALPEIFEMFDFADTTVVTGLRNSSIIAPQALYFLNHPFVMKQSRRAAERLLAEGSLSTFGRLDRMYQLALGRAPTDAESSIAERRLAGNPRDIEAWTELVQALFASIEFRYL
jgi:hypothetical protein